MTEFRIQLREKVRDRITGFSGTATARYMYPNGCIRIEVTPRIDKDGNFVEGRVFDENDIEVLEVLASPEAKKSTGGPPITRPVAR